MKLLNLLFISGFGFGFLNHFDKSNLIIDFPTENDDLIKICGTMLLSLPIIFRNGEKCKSDNDCPSIMKCCQIGNYKYCCTPNNYVKLEFAYVKNYIR